MTTDLLNSAYGIKAAGLEENKRDVNSIYEKIIGQVSMLTTVENKDLNYNELEFNARILNSYAKEIARTNKKHALVYFKKDEDAKKFFGKSEKEQKAKNITNAKNSVKDFQYGKFYSRIDPKPSKDSNDDLPYNISGVYTTQPIDTRNIEFYYKDFSKELQKIISSTPEFCREYVFNNIFANQMNRTYLLGKNDLSNPNASDTVKTAYSELRDIIKENVFSDKDFDDEEVAKKLEVLNIFSKEKAINGRKCAAYSFRDKQTESTFFMVKDIIKLARETGMTEEDIYKGVKEIVDASYGNSPREEKNGNSEQEIK